MNTYMSEEKREEWVKKQIHGIMSRVGPGKIIREFDLLTEVKKEARKKVNVVRLDSFDANVRRPLYITDCISDMIRNRELMLVDGGDTYYFSLPLLEYVVPQETRGDK